MCAQKHKGATEWIPSYEQCPLHNLLWSTRRISSMKLILESIFGLVSTGAFDSTPKAPSSRIPPPLSVYGYPKYPKGGNVALCRHSRTVCPFGYLAVLIVHITGPIRPVGALQAQSTPADTETPMPAHIFTQFEKYHIFFERSPECRQDDITRRLLRPRHCTRATS